MSHPTTSRAAALVAAVTLAASTVALTTTPATAGPAKKSARISLTAPSVTLGQATTLRGRVVSQGRPVTGRKVVLKVRLPGSPTFRRIGTVRTNSAGRYALRFVPGSGATYVARFTGTKRIKPRTSAARAAQVRVSTSFVPDRSVRAVAGTVGRAAGATSARLAGATVTIQRRSGASWVPVGSAVVQGSGRWSGSYRHNAPGTQTYRAAPSSARGITATASSPATMTVWGWYYLGDLDRVESLRFTSRPAAIAGRTFARAPQNSANFWWSKTPYGVWNLSYRCVTFAATVGLTDSSPSDHRVRFVSSLDGAERDWGAFTPGSGQNISLDVTGAFRLRLEDRYEAGVTGSGPATGVGAWGDARVLCSGKP